MTTVHANTPRDALSRIEQMIGMAAASMSAASIRSQIASGVQLILQLQRMADGRRRMTSLAEITGMEGDVIQMQEIFSFVREGIDAGNQIIGQFRAAGVRPKFLTELRSQGIEVPAQAFDPRHSLSDGRHEGALADLSRGVRPRRHRGPAISKRDERLDAKPPRETEALQLARHVAGGRQGRYPPAKVFSVA